jgi:flagella basal body P-ring formation protein FlgA
MKLALVLLFHSQVSYGEVLLRVRSHVVVAPLSEVKLSQIVDSRGLSEDGRKQMDSITLSLGPADGERQELAESNVSAAIRPIVANERRRSSGRVHVVIPKSVVIDTRKRVILEDAVRMEIMQTWQPLCSDCRLEIEALSLPKISGIRDWTMKMKAELPKGSFSIPVEIIRENGSMSIAWISGRLMTKRQMPVAKRMLNMGERVQVNDVTWEWRDTSYAFDGIPGQEELVGKLMKQGVRSGDPIWRGMIAKDKAIRRGDLVTVRSGDGIWEVSMQVQAQGDAYIGDIVNMKHPKTNAILVGQVTAIGEVELR